MDDSEGDEHQSRASTSVPSCSSFHTSENIRIPPKEHGQLVRKCLRMVVKWTLHMPTLCCAVSQLVNRNVKGNLDDSERDEHQSWASTSVPSRSSFQHHLGNIQCHPHISQSTGSSSLHMPVLRCAISQLVCFTPMRSKRIRSKWEEVKIESLLTSMTPSSDPASSPARPPWTSEYWRVPSRLVRSLLFRIGTSSTMSSISSKIEERHAGLSLTNP